MGKDLKQGNWFENQKEIADKVQNLSSSGNLESGSHLAEAITLTNGFSVGSSPNNKTTIAPTALLTQSLVVVTHEGDVYMPNLPTSDPTSAGQLWSNSGVVTVSAG